MENTAANKTRMRTKREITERLTELRALLVRAQEVGEAPDHAVERIGARIEAIEWVLGKDNVPQSYCVECGAATELDCICDDLNHAV